MQHQAAVATAVAPPLPMVVTRECDYDTSPTRLYQAIEGRRWSQVLELLDQSSEECSVWINRKEHNGRLRWRLLPIHAAIIFQAPNQVVEILLTEYPAGAAAKDDQGMLPLHLAFRNQPLNWWMLEDLLTAHPAAVFVKDRKGRTPLAGGMAAAAAGPHQQQNRFLAALHKQAELSSSTSMLLSPKKSTGIVLSPSSAWLQQQQQSPSTGDSATVLRHVVEEHKAALSVMELYTSIVVAGEKTRWKQQHDGEDEEECLMASAEGHHHHPPQYWRQQMAGLAEQHAQRLTELRDAFAREQALRQRAHFREMQELRRKLLRKNARIVEEVEGIEVFEQQTSGVFSNDSTVPENGRDEASPEDACDEEEEPTNSNVTDEPREDKQEEEASKRQKKLTALRSQNQELRRMVHRLLLEQQAMAQTMEQHQMAVDQESRRSLAQQQVWNHEQVKAWKEQHEHIREDLLRQFESISTADEEYLPPTVSASTATSLSTAAETSDQQAEKEGCHHESSIVEQPSDELLERKMVSRKFPAAESPGPSVAYVEIDDSEVANWPADDIATRDEKKTSVHEIEAVTSTGSKTEVMQNTCKDVESFASELSSGEPVVELGESITAEAMAARILAWRQVKQEQRHA